MCLGLDQETFACPYADTQRIPTGPGHVAKARGLGAALVIGARCLEIAESLGAYGVAGSAIMSRFGPRLHPRGISSWPRGGSDDFAFACHGVPAIGLGALSWDYGTTTRHTERDTYDKVVIDDRRYNATLTAMLVYAAAEDPARIPLDRVGRARVPRH